MTIVDANYFLRYFVRPVSPQDEQMAQTAAALFRRVEAGQETITTTDAVIAEVVFILASKRHYHLPRPDVVARLRPILHLPGFKLAHKQLVLQALDLWASAPKLSFVDALGAVHAQRRRLRFASFDADVASLPGITLWQPPASVES